VSVCEFVCAHLGCVCVGVYVIGGARVRAVPTRIVRFRFLFFFCEFSEVVSFSEVNSNVSQSDLCISMKDNFFCIPV